MPCVLPLPEPVAPVVEAVEAAAPVTDFVGDNTTFLPLVNGGGAVEAAASSQSTTVTKYYFLGTQRVALQEGSDFRYVHSDHLGSTAIETNLSGQVSAERRYLAFGGERASSGTLRTENQFTSQKLDETGLYYYGARYYDPALGQFVSPDTIVPDETEVFAYNRYMYGYGNPVKFNDPSGHCPAVTRENHAEAAGCHQLATTILQQWDKTEETAAYWNTRWGSKEIFETHIYGYDHNDLVFMQNEWKLFTESDAFASWENDVIPINNRGAINVDLGDYKSVSLTTGVNFVTPSLIFDDYGNTYFSLSFGPSYGLVSVTAGDILVSCQG